MKSELIYPCDNCMNRYDCNDQWYCQNWWDYFFENEEELKEKLQTKNKRIKVHLVKNPCDNCQLSTEDDCDMMGDFCKEKKEYQHKRIAAMKNEQRRKTNEKNSCSN